MTESDQISPVVVKKASFDIIIFGASGYTGSLITEWFVRNVKSRCRWAVAARNEKKLELLRERLRKVLGQDFDQFSMLVADIRNEESLNHMASSTRVLIDCVGPFVWWGEPVVKTCIKNNTHYIDINGEPEYSTMLVRKYHRLAAEAKVLIIPCCGFDSVPADVGAYEALRFFKGSRKVAVRQYIESENIQVSGGTLKTIVNSVLPNAPFFQTVTTHPSYCRELKKWAFPLATSDSLIVKRSAMLNREHYPEQVDVTTYLLGSFVHVLLLMFFLWLGVLLVRIPLVRQVTSKIVSVIGDGPIVKSTKNSRVSLITLATDDKKTYKVTVSGGDPYDQTARFVSLCALLLTEGKMKTFGGVVSPVAAFGDDLVQHLPQYGIMLHEENLSGQTPLT